MALRILLLLVSLLAGAAAVDYQEVVIENPAARVVISTQRGSINRFELTGSAEIRLPKHLQREEPGEKGQPLAVLAPFAVPDTPTAREQATNQHAWLVNDRGATTYWGLTGKDFAPWTIADQAADGSSVTLSYDPGRGIAYAITWRMHATLPRVEATVTARNTGTAEITLNASLVPVNGIHQDYAPGEVVYLTSVLHTGGEQAGAIATVAVPATGQPLAKITPETGAVDFVGLKSRFFSVWWTPGSLGLDGASTAPAAPVAPDGAVGPGAQAIAPPAAGSGPVWRADVGGYLTSPHKDHQGFVQVTYGPQAVPPGRSLVSTWTITASSMARSDLAHFGQAEKRIDQTDWMHRTFIIFTTPLIIVLDWIVSVVGNYAIAVILLTFLVKAAMFRLTWKQHASMIAMQKVAPELKYIQEQYKGDKQKMAQKQMELWKKHGVNPLGGCLPLLVQIPIFIALYNAFQYNADMRGAHFLWISDLTLPDQILGMHLAFLDNWVLSLNPLPIIYIGVTVWMSMTTPMPTGGDPQQEQIAKMMRWMPVLFGVIFYNMPAGLVLYFTVNALISTLEVKFIRKRLAAK